jgi:endonuclease/exonuclease/phosphatase (EEP) superfamily protein YafD
MYSKFICSVVAILTLSCQSFAVSKGGYDIPADKDTVLVFGKSVTNELPRKFRLLDWNIEKAKQGEVWANDFSKLQKGYDLILIQEAVSEDIFMNALKERGQTLWNYFVAWIRKTERSSSGLVMGSQVKPTSTFFTRTTDVETYIKTPKLASYQTYKVQGLKNAELLLINIHAINFVSTEKFGRHIGQVMEKIDAHKGPVIFVGDMNTWKQPRVDLLMAEAKKRNLVWYDFERPNVKGMHSKLDHIFVRGLKTSVKSLTDVISSDHYPISAEFEVL